MDKANEKQIVGDHYQGSTIQHWDLAAARNYDYFQGQITKYIDRWKNKNGVQDLLKAQHFLEKYIELNTLPATSLAKWYKENSLRFNLHGSEKNMVTPVDQPFDEEFDLQYSLYRCKKCGTTLAASSLSDVFNQHGSCKPRVSPDNN
jgi:hypothetical protein